MPKLQTLEAREHNLDGGILYYVQNRQHTIHISMEEDNPARAHVIRSGENVAALRGSPHQLQVKGS